MRLAIGQSVGASFILICIIFFFSGFSAIIYQVVWQRSLFSIFGINVEAVTVVIAGFLLGLGLGSLFGGRLSHIRWINLLALFGSIELSIGVFGIASLHVFRWVGARTATLPTIHTAIVTIILLLAPTLLMGATLPILTQYLVDRARNVGQSVGLLYCVNTLGSAAGCFACAIWLMRVMGMQGAVDLAATINILVGSCALCQALVTRRLFPIDSASFLETKHRTIPATAVAQQRSSFIFVLAMATLIGYISLSYEIVWFRVYIVATNLAPAFAIVLGSFLTGLSLGSYAARRYCEATINSPRLVYGLCIAIVASSVMGFLVLPIAAQTAPLTLAVFVMAMPALIMLQTAISGAILPIICHLGVAPDELAGIRLSRIYVANILGSVVGTLITGFTLMDFLTTVQISIFLSVLGAIVAAAVSGIAPIPRQRRFGVALSAAATIVAVLSLTSLFDRFYDKIILRKHFATSPLFSDLVENRSGVIAVTQDHVVYGGGAYDGVIAVDLVADENHLIRPISLSLYHPQPREVLMIGLSTGAWAQIIASHPDVRRLTVVEINPGYFGIIKKYPVVRSILKNPKVEIIVDDGRRWMKRNPERRFDVIVQNTTFNYRPNVTNLLSEEYLQLARQHLRQGGVMMYNSTWSDRAQRTGCKIFPHGFMVMNMVVVSDAPFVFNGDRLMRTLAEYMVDGRPVFDFSNPQHHKRLQEILSQLDIDVPVSIDGRPSMETCRSVLARTNHLATITDDNMGEEWQFRSIVERLGDPGNAMILRVLYYLGIPLEQ